MDTKGRRQGGMNWEIGIGIQTLLILCSVVTKGEGNPRKRGYMNTYG